MLETILLCMAVVFPIWAISAFISRDRDPEPEPEPEPEDDGHGVAAVLAILAALLFVGLGFASVGVALVEVVR